MKNWHSWIFSPIVLNQKSHHKFVNWKGTNSVFGIEILNTYSNVLFYFQQKLQLNSLRYNRVLGPVYNN